MNYRLCETPGNGREPDLLRHAIDGGPKLEKRLDQVLSEFSRRAGERPFDDIDATAEVRVALAADLFVGILRLHPFLYGNLAIATVALSTAYKRLSLTPKFPTFKSGPANCAIAEVLLSSRSSPDLKPLVSVLMAGDGETPVQITPWVPGPSGFGRRHPETVSDADASRVVDGVLVPEVGDD